MFLLGAGSITYVGYQWFSTMPRLDEVFISKNHTKLFDKQANIKYLDSDGSLIYQSSDDTFKELSVRDVNRKNNVVKALLAIEDRNFYDESGVNYKRTFKSVLDTIFTDRVVGGSTITQQLVKLSFYSTSKKDQTVKRKFQEIILAEQLNSKFSKNQILAWYLSKVSFGNGQQGIIAAAKYYYNKSIDDLSVLEASTLIGMVNAPTQYNPYVNPEQAKNRRNEVLYALYDSGSLSKREYKKLSTKSVTDGMVTAKDNVSARLERREQRLQYNGFISAVDLQINRYNTDILKNSITVKTSMNKGLQDKVNKIVSSFDYPDDKLQESIVVMDNRTGDVIALSGGRTQTVLGGYNRAFNSRRSSGSTIKPLLDYAPGMDLYHWTKDKKFDDSKFIYPNSDIEVKDWDRKHQGVITMEQALVQSRNVPAVKALMDVGLSNGAKVLDSLGLYDGSIYYPNAIGVDVSPLMMASSYSSLANYGKRANAKFVNEVQYNGRKLLMSSVYENVYSPQTGYLMTDMLKGVFEASGTAADSKVDDIVAAGKTGTIGRSNDDSGILTDSWMIGYTKSHTVCVWVGYDDPYDKNYELTNDKAKISRDLYKAVMSEVKSLKTFDGSDWTAPVGVKDFRYESDVDTMSDNFSQVRNRKHATLPFYLNNTPEYLLNKPDKLTLNELYKSVD